MEWNYSKLRGKIKEKCGTQEEFSSKIGISKSSLSQKLNNRIEFTQDEIYKACNVLEIPDEDIFNYFFCP